MNSLYKEEPIVERPVFSLAYPEIPVALSQASGGGQTAVVDGQGNEPRTAAGPSPAEIEALVKRTRAEAEAATEKRLRREYEEKLLNEAAQIKKTIELFVQERRDYFSRVEEEVVRLALAIAAKILHREAQVDPMLIAALVRVATEKMHEGSNVSIRVSPAEADRWRKYLGDSVNGSTVSVCEDSQLDAKECIVETDLGTADFSIGAQLKELEQGLFDLLAQRPRIQ